MNSLVFSLVAGISMIVHSRSLTQLRQVQVYIASKRSWQNRPGRGMLPVSVSQRKGGSTMPGLFALSIDPRDRTRPISWRICFWARSTTSTWVKRTRACRPGRTDSSGSALIGDSFAATFSRDLEGMARNRRNRLLRLGPGALLLRIQARHAVRLLLRATSPTCRNWWSASRDFGHVFTRGDDIEIITKLVAQGTDVVEGIQKLATRSRGRLLPPHSHRRRGSMRPAAPAVTGRW